MNHGASSLPHRTRNLRHLPAPVPGFSAVLWGAGILGEVAKPCRWGKTFLASDYGAAGKSAPGKGVLAAKCRQGFLLVCLQKHTLTDSHSRILTLSPRCTTLPLPLTSTTYIHTDTRSHTHNILTYKTPSHALSQYTATPQTHTQGVLLSGPNHLAL